VDTHCVKGAKGPCNRTLKWVSRGAFNFDIFVTASADKDTALPSSLQRYVEATGHPTAMPHWVSGFWQSKNRYRNCSEVLYIARKYKELRIPLAVMIIDEGAWCAAAASCCVCVLLTAAVCPVACLCLPAAAACYMCLLPATVLCQGPARE